MVQKLLRLLQNQVNFPGQWFSNGCHLAHQGSNFLFLGGNLF